MTTFKEEKKEISVIKMLCELKDKGNLNKFISTLFYELQIGQILKVNSTVSELLKYLGITIVGSSKNFVVIEDGEYTASITYKVNGNKRAYNFNTLSLM